MSAFDRRLHKLEGALSPTAAVLHLLEEIAPLGSLAAYAATLQGQPEAAFPLVKVPRALEQAVHDHAKHLAREERWRLTRQAVRDGGLLLYLVLDVNGRFAEQHQLHATQVVLLLMEGERIVRGGATDPVQQAARTERLVPLLAQILAWERIERTISARYFAGHPVLLPEPAAALRALVTTVQEGIELYNDYLEGYGLPVAARGRKRAVSLAAAALDLKAVTTEAERVASERVDLFVDLAKAQALELIGETEQGRALVARHIWPAEERGS